MSRRLDDLYEEAGRRIYESQQSRLSDQTSLAAKRPWRSKEVPTEFWDGYCEDARAAFSLTIISSSPANSDDPPASVGTEMRNDGDIVLSSWAGKRK